MPRKGTYAKMSKEQKRAAVLLVNIWSKKNRKRRSFMNLKWTYKRKYGLTFEKVQKMALDQIFKCPITGQALYNGKRRFHVDHDHLSGKVRGLLSHNANAILGFANDNIDVLKNAIAYLERSKNPPVALLPDFSETYCQITDQRTTCLNISSL